MPTARFPISAVAACSSGVEKFIVNSPIGVAVSWPYPLNGYCPINLCISGHVVRSNSSGTAVAIDSDEFRTAGRIDKNGQSLALLERGVPGTQKVCFYEDGLNTSRRFTKHICAVFGSSGPLLCRHTSSHGPGSAFTPRRVACES